MLFRGRREHETCGRLKSSNEKSTFLGVTRISADLDVQWYEKMVRSSTKSVSDLQASSARSGLVRSDEDEDANNLIRI